MCVQDIHSRWRCQVANEFNFSHCSKHDECMFVCITGERVIEILHSERQNSV